jgi:DNA polymerase, archaea type
MRNKDSELTFHPETEKVYSVTSVIMNTLGSLGGIAETHNSQSPRPNARHEWLYGWDATPGIVGVHAESNCNVFIWRRMNGCLTLERDRFQPWVYARHCDHVPPSSRIAAQHLEGDGFYEYLLTSPDWRHLKDTLLDSSRRAGREAKSLNELPEYYSLGLTDQYLIATGRTYFRDLEYRDLVRLQLDLETTAFRASEGQIFMISVRDSLGFETVLEGDETQMLRDLVSIIRARDPDVIENHNLMGFDLPFLEERARVLGVRLEFGRLRNTLRREGRDRYCAPGRELIDTLDAVWRHDFVTRELPSHGLKAVAKHFGLAAPDRVYLRGGEIADTYRRDPQRVRAYALEDVREVDRLSARLLPATFALTKLAGRKYERVAGAGMATGILEPMLVRAYHRERRALPKSQHTHLPHPHEGGAVQLFARGVAKNAVKADIASLYPSVMRAFRIGPQCDTLEVLLELVEEMTKTRLEHKKIAKSVPKDHPSFAHADAMQAALKLIINSAYGYLAAGDMALFADRGAADRITETGRRILETVIQGLKGRGVTLLEADTDGVFFSLADGVSESEARGLVQSVSDELPAGINLEFDAMYQSMLSHDLKNYALLHGDGTLTLRGVAFRSSRFEPFGARFLETAVRAILNNDLRAVRNCYLETLHNLHSKSLRACDVVTLAKLKKPHAKYLESRAKLREAAYEAALQTGKPWLPGERIRWYRATGGKLIALSADPDSGNPLEDATDYDVSHYVDLFHRTYVNRLEHAFTPAVFQQVFRSSVQEGLFDSSLETLAVRWV